MDQVFAIFGSPAGTERSRIPQPTENRMQTCGFSCSAAYFPQCAEIIYRLFDFSLGVFHIY